MAGNRARSPFSRRRPPDFARSGTRRWQPPAQAGRYAIRADREREYRIQVPTGTARDTRRSGRLVCFSPRSRLPAPPRGSPARWNASPASAPPIYGAPSISWTVKMALTRVWSRHPLRLNQMSPLRRSKNNPPKPSAAISGTRFAIACALTRQSVARANSSFTARWTRASPPMPPRSLRRLRGRRLSYRSLQALPMRRWKIFAGSHTEAFRSPLPATMSHVWCGKPTKRSRRVFSLLTSQSRRMQIRCTSGYRIPWVGAKRR